MPAASSIAQVLSVWQATNARYRAAGARGFSQRKRSPRISRQGSPTVRTKSITNVQLRNAPQPGKIVEEGRLLAALTREKLRAVGLPTDRRNTARKPAKSKWKASARIP